MVCHIRPHLPSKLVQKPELVGNQTVGLVTSKIGGFGLLVLRQMPNARSLSF